MVTAHVVQVSLNDDTSLLWQFSAPVASVDGDPAGFSEDTAQGIAADIQGDPHFVLVSYDGNVFSGDQWFFDAVQADVHFVGAISGGNQSGKIF